MKILAVGIAMLLSSTLAVQAQPQETKKHTASKAEEQKIKSPEREGKEYLKFDRPILPVSLATLKALAARGENRFSQQ